MGEPEGRHILCSSFNPPPEATPTLPRGKSTEETRMKLQAWGGVCTSAILLEGRNRFRDSC